MVGTYESLNLPVRVRVGCGGCMIVVHEGGVRSISECAMLRTGSGVWRVERRALRCASANCRAAQVRPLLGNGLGSARLASPHRAKAGVH